MRVDLERVHCVANQLILVICYISTVSFILFFDFLLIFLLIYFFLSQFSVLIDIL